MIFVHIGPRSKLGQTLLKDHLNKSSQLHNYISTLPSYPQLVNYACVNLNPTTYYGKKMSGRLAKKRPRVDYCHGTVSLGQDSSHSAATTVDYSTITGQPQGWRSL